jgi:hypothetical protein
MALTLFAIAKLFAAAWELNVDKQVHSCRSEDALAQKRCEIKAEGRGDASKKWFKKSLKTELSGHNNSFTVCAFRIHELSSDGSNALQK